jgi:hypothetical protein
VTVLLVGADRLGNIPHELEHYGCKEIIHWTGRKERTKPIPERVEMVLVIHDFINHGLMDSVKTQAKRRRLPILFAKRGIAGLKRALAEHGK